MEHGTRSTLGAYIKACRENRGLKLRDVAAALKVDPSNVSKWETGTTIPNLKRIKELAEAIGCSQESLALLIAEATSEEATDLRHENRLMRAKFDEMITRVDRLDETITRMVDRVLRAVEGRNCT